MTAISRIWQYACFALALVPLSASADTVRIYVTNSAGDSIHVIDATNKVVQVFMRKSVPMRDNGRMAFQVWQLRRARTGGITEAYGAGSRAAKPEMAGAGWLGRGLINAQPEPY